MQRHEAKRESEVLVLHSGGIDSTACLRFYTEQSFVVSAMFIDYGQASRKNELAAARAITKRLRIPLSTIRVQGARKKSSGLIVGRNAFLVMVALLELVPPIRIIALGIHAGTRYPDCSMPFVSRIQKILDIYTGGQIQLGAPFLNWRKSDIWNFCTTHRVPLQMTYSCERGMRKIWRATGRNCASRCARSTESTARNGK